MQSDTSHMFNCVYWKREKFLNFVSFWFKENSTVLTVYFNHCLNFRKYDARGENAEGKWKRNITETFLLWLVVQNFGNFSHFCKFCIFNELLFVTAAPRHLQLSYAFSNGQHALTFKTLDLKWLVRTPAGLNRPPVTLPLQFLSLFHNNPLSNPEAEVFRIFEWKYDQS